MLTVLPGLAKPAGAEPWSARQERSVPGRNAVVLPAGPDQAKEKEVRTPPTVTWPKAGAAELPLTGDLATRAQAADFPVRVGLPERAASMAEARQAAPSRVRVEVLDRLLDGPVLRVNRSDGGTTAGRVSVEVDYSSFRNAFGGDWATRLRLVALPECALRTPDRDDCQGTALSTRNDGSGRLVADASAPPKDADAKDTEPGSSGLYAVRAMASGGAGDFGASQLSPSSSWTVGGASGDFNWSYPMSVPPALNGPAPQLALGYSSGGVDGRTSATNNQPSWAGEGFDFTPGGFIERRYKSCGMDRTQEPENGGAPNNKDHKKTGDQCWATDNAYFSLNGKGGELVRDNNDKQRVWHPRQDDGSRVEQLFGADNGDSDGEYWRITTRNGTDRGGYLTRIEYGQRDKEVFSALPVARVVVRTADRCLPNTPAADCVPGKPGNWPDTPWDQYCASSASVVCRPAPVNKFPELRRLSAD